MEDTKRPSITEELWAVFSPTTRNPLSLLATVPGAAIFAAVVSDRLNLSGSLVKLLLHWRDITRGLWGEAFHRLRELLPMLMPPPPPFLDFLTFSAFAIVGSLFSYFMPGREKLEEFFTRIMPLSSRGRVIGLWSVWLIYAAVSGVFMAGFLESSFEKTPLSTTALLALAILGFGFNVFRCIAVAAEEPPRVVRIARLYIIALRIIPIFFASSLLFYFVSGRIAELNVAPPSNASESDDTLTGFRGLITSGAIYFLVLFLPTASAYFRLFTQNWKLVPSVFFVGVAITIGVPLTNILAPSLDYLMSFVPNN